MRYKVLVREIRIVEREIVLAADSKKLARLAAEDPGNWLEETPLAEDMEASELTGIDVVSLTQLPEDEAT